MITLAQNSNIRRIDELGRIVIPKDIRKKLHIKDSEPLEIFIEGDEIHIKKYSSLPDIVEYVNFLFDTSSRITGNEYILTTREKVLLSTDLDYKEKALQEELKKMVLSCTEMKNEQIEFLLEDSILKGNANIVPIIVDNDRSGLLIEFNKDRAPGNMDTVKIYANLIENRLNCY